MSDWTTRKISGDTEIDLHYDLHSFPAQLRTTQPICTSILLTKEEAHTLMLVLIEYFGGVYSTG